MEVLEGEEPRRNGIGVVTRMLVTCIGFRHLTESRHVETMESFSNLYRINEKLSLLHRS